jgi:hypothetical protein
MNRDNDILWAFLLGAFAFGLGFLWPILAFSKQIDDVSQGTLVARDQFCCISIAGVTQSYIRPFSARALAMTAPSPPEPPVTNAFATENEDAVLFLSSEGISLFA